MLLDNVTNSVYSDEQMTQGNPNTPRDLSLSLNHSHLYALTDQRVCIRNSSATVFGFASIAWMGYEVIMKCLGPK